MKIPLSLKILIKTMKPLSYVAPHLVASFWVSKFMTPFRHKRPGWEEEIVKGGEAIELRGGIKAWAFGQGPLVLLAHGWDGRGSQMGRFVKPLVESGFRVVTFDGPAHGDSPGTWTNLVFYAREMVTITDDLVDRFGPLHGVVAHSFGSGASALAITLGMDVKKIVMVASPCSIQNVLDRFTGFVEMGPRARQEFQSLIENMTGYRASQIEVDRMVDRMPGVQAVLFHDPEDEEIPYSEAECIARSWKDSKLVTVKGVGHRRILKDPVVIEQTVSFLASIA